MFDRFTDRAKAAMGKARSISSSSGFEEIGSGSIFVGLLENPKSSAFQILKLVGVDPIIFLAEARRICSIPEEPVAEPTKTPLPFSSNSKLLIEASLDEASRLSHNYIGTEHLLLAIGQLSASTDRTEEEFIAGKAFERLGVDLPSLRLATVDFLTDPPSYEAGVDSFGEPEPLVVLLDPGTATEEEAGELLADFSLLFRMIGGSGISFKPTDIKNPEVA